MNNKDATAVACCPQYDNLPVDVKCFLPGICSEFSRLVRRKKRMITKRKALLRLAEPRRCHTNQRYVAKCPCKLRRPVQVIRLYRDRSSTRIDQLAYPCVRKLLIFKQCYKHLLSCERLASLNRLIRYSLLSLYSRLENIQPPEKTIPIKKWTDAEWKTHKKYLKKLAKPKKPPKPPKLEKLEMPYESMNRYKTLAMSRNRPETIKEDWKLLPGVKLYTPSPRILEIAKPLIREDMHTVEQKIEPTALKYKASPRIKELATARERNIGAADLKENPFAIAPNALKAKASQRTQELAEPKEFENAHIRENPFAISPAALKAKASPRIIELAKPKGS